MMEKAFAEVSTALAMANWSASSRKAVTAMASCRFPPRHQPHPEANPVPVVPLALSGLVGQLFFADRRPCDENTVSAGLVLVGGPARWGGRRAGVGYTGASARYSPCLAWQ
jgi:hypothetical protein